MTLNAMTNDRETQKQIAEHLRLAYKELRWAAKNIGIVHDLMRPDDEPPIDDPNQLKLFNDETD